MSTKYEEVGVDAQKEGIEVFKSTIDNLFPEAFCTVSRDPERENQGIVLHTDSAGSKPIQNYLQWKETDNLEWFESIAQDVIAMNLDDIICIGAKPSSFVDYIAINKELFPKEDVLDALNSGFGKVLQKLENLDMDISFLGGETADLPDQMKTLDVCGTIHGRVELSKAITGKDVEPGNVIVGLESGGKASYEDEKNSGIMCNGITLARHSLMEKEYEEKYPEIRGAEKGYYGSFEVEDYHENLGMTVGEAVVSPTRIYAPVVSKILESYREQVNGLVHNTGGGQTKCLNLGENVHYVKDNLINPDPIFNLIKEESGESWRAMFMDYNMGCGLEAIVEKEYADKVVDISRDFNIDAEIIGRCKESDGENKVTIKSQFGNFEYGERRD